MGKYSQADLLKEELSLIGSSDLFGRFLQKMNKTSTVLLSIDVPKNLYLRAEVFCEDIQDLSEMSFSRTRIERLRGQQISELIPRKQSKSIRSEDVLVKTLKTRIKALEEENKQLKEQVQKLYGKLF